MREDWWWWDWTWNTVGGCSPVSVGCKNCYAPRDAGTRLKTSAPHEVIGLYKDVADLINGRWVFNGQLRIAPPGHPQWTLPLRRPSVMRPLLGPGMPNLVFVNSESDTFHEDLPIEVINRIVGTLASSDHIGLLLTKRPNRMLEYFLAAEQSLVPGMLAGWRQRFWLGFSAERQQEFDRRWPVLRPLAESGWNIFVSIAPMLGRVTLPDDFLRLGKWVIVSGEQAPNKVVRKMDTRWARALHAQCTEADVPFFLRRLWGLKPVPPDLHVRQLPRLKITDVTVTAQMQPTEMV